MLGRGGMYVEECVRDGYIGVDFNIYEDLSAALPENWREFNKRYIPVFMEANPDKSKVAAGLSCSMLWTICKGLQIDDVVISPDGNGQYYVGQITGGYYYVPNSTLPHRRRIKWQSQKISRSDMSVELRNSSGSVGTCCNITTFGQYCLWKPGSRRPC